MGEAVGGMMLLRFAFLVGLSLLGVNGIQHPLSLDFPVAHPEALPPNVSTGNFIFNALASLLQQLPNTLHPNGHAIVPAVIRAHTTLWHAFPSIREYPVRAFHDDVLSSL
jgi:hypothetical protein